jgi:hypothetical protein
MKRTLLTCFFLIGFVSFQNERLLALNAALHVKANMQNHLNNTTELNLHSSHISFLTEGSYNDILFDADENEQDNKSKPHIIYGFQYYSDGDFINISKNKDRPLPDFPIQRFFNKIFILNSVFLL